MKIEDIYSPGSFFNIYTETLNPDHLDQVYPVFEEYLRQLCVSNDIPWIVIRNENSLLVKCISGKDLNYIKTWIEDFPVPAYRATLKEKLKKLFGL